MDLKDYLASQKPALPVASEGNNVVGFGARAKDIWRQIWESRADGYAAFILGVKYLPNSKMYNLQQYIRKQQTAEACPPPPAVPSASPASTQTSGTISQLNKCAKADFMTIFNSLDINVIVQSPSDGGG